MESSCLKLPAAAFLGLANCFESLKEFISLNPFFDIKTSPLISIILGILVPSNFNGIDLIVLIFSVTFSPVRPSPRVAAKSKIPFLYNKLMASQSNFGSAENFISSQLIINFFSNLSIYEFKSEE